MNIDVVLLRMNVLSSLCNKIKDARFFECDGYFDEAFVELKNIREHLAFDDSIFGMRLEFNDNLDLFKIACVSEFDEIAAVKFSTMIDILKRIRKKTADRTERSKKIWTDDTEHEKGIRREKRADLMKEATDLIKLYDVALECKYKDGMDLILAKLNVISPELVRDLSIR